MLIKIYVAVLGKIKIYYVLVFSDLFLLFCFSFCVFSRTKHTYTLMQCVTAILLRGSKNFSLIIDVFPFWMDLV
jgi:hypothetical protein